MKTIELVNARCRAILTPERSGCVTSFRAFDARGREGPEHVGNNFLQLWVKVGEHHDSAAGMLHLFHGTLHRETAQAKSDAGSCEFTSADESVTFRKRFTLDPALPVLNIHAEVTNTGKETLNLQIECSFNWSFGAASSRNNVLTTVINKDGTKHVHLPPYGDIRADLFDADGGTLALCDVENLETLLITSRSNMKRFTIYQMAGSNWRGPYSIEKKLAPGETLEASLSLSLLTRTGALSVLDGLRVVGLLPDRDIWFADEPVTATLAVAQFKDLSPWRENCFVFSDNKTKLHGFSFYLETTGLPYTGVSDRLTIEAGKLPPGDHQIEAEFDRRTLRSPIRVLDPAASHEPPVRKAAKPAFSVRAIHLILSQQANTEALTLDALKWFTEHAVAACGYSHVIWEFNNTLRLSHPELAGAFSFTPAQIADLAKFTRSLGIEPIPEQNLYGHQHETNLVKAHPELAEAPGDVSVYCPTHAKTRAIVDDIVAELIDIFEAKFFHMGHDEIQFQGMPQRIGICPRCHEHGKPHEVFAHDVNAIADAARKHGARCILWGDLLIHPSCGGQNVNGELGEIHNALDLIPRDAIIADWHYFPTENYQSTNYFLAKGHEVWDAVWYYKDGIRRFALHAEMTHAPGMIFTTWCRPDMASVPIESMMYAGQCFQDIDAVGPAEIDDRLMIAAHRLWRKWKQWSSKK